jgi:hypothetical protein
MSDLFVKLMRYCKHSEEDFFTECVAATLKADLELVRGFLKYICGNEIDGVSISTSNVQVETQKVFPHADIDLVFYLDRGKSIGVENKLWSPEGKGQLSKYLNLQLDQLAYITGYYSQVSEEVFKNPHYLKPPNGRQHFMWSDFYPIVSESIAKPSASMLNHALLALFDDLGFDPPYPKVGELLHTTPPEVGRKNRENFKKLWNLTQQRLQERGWKKLYSGSIAELYVEKGSSKNIVSAWLDPMWQRGSLRIRLTPKDNVDLSRLINDLKSFKFPFKDQIKVIQNLAPRKGGRITVIEVLIPHKTLFANTSDSESMARRLAEFVLAVFDGAS